jgi:hypothetical protein
MEVRRRAETLLALLYNNIVSIDLTAMAVTGIFELVRRDAGLSSLGKYHKLYYYVRIDCQRVFGISLGNIYLYW